MPYVHPAELVTLGATNVRVSRLSLGGTPFGDMYATVPDDQAVATVEAAFEAGVRYFDTAPLYGVGRAERRLGLGLRHLPRDEVVVSTKVGRILQDEDGTIPPTFEYTPEAIERSLAGSYERLGLDRVDIVHVHDPDHHMDEVMEVTLPALRKLQADGVIGAVSAGMNHSAPLARFVTAGLVDSVLVAGRWTLLDQSALDDLLPAAVEQGVSVIAAGVFNTGALADPDAGKQFANYFYRPAPPEIQDRVGRDSRCLRRPRCLVAAPPPCSSRSPIPPSPLFAWAAVPSRRWLPTPPTFRLRSHSSCGRTSPAPACCIPSQGPRSISPEPERGEHYQHEVRQTGPDRP